MFLALWAGIAGVVSAGSIENPSFEADGNILLDTADALGWFDNILHPYGGSIWDTNYHTDGKHGALLFSGNGDFSAGSNAHLLQPIDLTGASTLSFDAQLASDYGWLPFFEADVYVDSTKKWSKQTPGTYANQSIDVSGLSGLHAIEFRLQATSAGAASGNSCSYGFDNVRLNTENLPEPSTLALVVAGSVGLLVYGWRRRRRAA